METDIPDIRGELAKGNRVVLLVRHSERPRIAFEDKSFGGELPLTANGEQISVELGKMLADATDSVEFRASPLLRTRLTAELIAKGMGLAGAVVVPDARIGNGSSFIASELEVWALFRDGEFFKHMDEYMKNGVQRGFAPLASAAEEFERYVLSVFTAKLGVFTTHDVYIAAYLHAKGVKTDFCRENWPCFLDSAAIIIEPDGRRRYALVRSGLSTLVCGVS